MSTNKKHVYRTLFYSNSILELQAKIKKYLSLLDCFIDNGLLSSKNQYSCIELNKAYQIDFVNGQYQFNESLTYMQGVYNVKS